MCEKHCGARRGKSLQVGLSAEELATLVQSLKQAQSFNGEASKPLLARLELLAEIAALGAD